MTEDMGFRLRKIGRVALDVQSNPMGGAVDAEDQFEAHQVKHTSKALTIDSTISYITIMKYKLAALCACALACCAQSREHAEAGFTLRLPAPPSVVFPLFGPVRESEWSPHWNPAILYPPDRSQKAGAVFITREQDEDVIWVLTTYDESALRMNYVIVSPQRTAGELEIALKAVGDKETEATVTHRLTSLSGAGDVYVKLVGREFPQERNHWLQALTKRLRELASH